MNMKTVKVSGLSGAALDWVVAKCEGWETGTYMMSPDIRRDAHDNVVGIKVPINREYVWFKPSVDWAQGGPIIEREWLDPTPWPNESREDMRWHCQQYDSGGDCAQYGPTLLIAAMRCYVASTFGDTVEIPVELLTVNK